MQIRALLLNVPQLIIGGLCRQEFVHVTPGEDSCWIVTLGCDRLLPHSPFLRCPPQRREINVTNKYIHLFGAGWRYLRKGRFIYVAEERHFVSFFSPSLDVLCLQLPSFEFQTRALKLIGNKLLVWKYGLILSGVYFIREIVQQRVVCFRGTLLRAEYQSNWRIFAGFHPVFPRS